MSLILFETKRILCRRLSFDDIDDMYAVYSDADGMRWVDDGQPITQDDCVRWVDVTLNNYSTRGYGMSVLVSRETMEIIGFCGLVHPGNQSTAEIKYALHRAFWGRGLATEAVIAMLNYGKREFHLHMIIATVAPENLASRRVLLKAGMQEIEKRHTDDGSNIIVFEWRSAELGLC
ncbi:MAG: GNAT family N-acetyltransferase [Cyanobacteria bacterium P01_H01_bin.21]